MKKALILMMIVFLLIGCGNTESIDTELNYQTTTETENINLVTPNITVTEEVETVDGKEEVIEINTEAEEPTDEIGYTYVDMDKTMYAKQSVNVRDLPSTDGKQLGSLSYTQEVHVTGQCVETLWYRIEYGGYIAYVSNGYLIDEKLEEQNSESTGSVPTIFDMNDPYVYHLDYNRDGFVTEEEMEAYDSRFIDEYGFSDIEKFTMNAEYYTLVYINETTYSILTEGEDWLPDGRNEIDVVVGLLEQAGFKQYDLSGHWICSEDKLYIFIASDCSTEEKEIIWVN